MKFRNWIIEILLLCLILFCLWILGSQERTETARAWAMWLMEWWRNR